MSNYCLMIQYDGGRYRGWQRLGNGEQTVQGKIESAISAVVGRTIEIIGCSRTDAGVHALAQIANFKIDQQLPTAEIKSLINGHLPQDISIIKVTIVPENFHARYQAREKTYLYKIWNEEHPHPFMRKYSMHVAQRLNVANMRAAALHFLGKHDFTAFSNAKSKKKSFVREISAIEITEDAGFVQIRVCGDGFLHNMARKMVGALIAVGLGQMATGSITGIINSTARGQTGPMADACGLYLEKVEF